MKIAVTSQNFKTVTNHAGKARRFIIFTAQEGQEPCETERLDLPKDMAFSQFNDDKNHPVDNVDVILSSSFGAGFADRMQKRGILAKLTSQEQPILAVKEFLKNNPVLPEESKGNCDKKKECHNCQCK